MKKKLINFLIYITPTLLLWNTSFAANLLNVRSFFHMKFEKNEVPADLIFIKNKIYILEAKKGNLLRINLKAQKIEKKIHLNDAEGGIGITFFNNNIYIPIPLKNRVNIYSFKNFKKINEIYITDPTDIEFYKNRFLIVSNDKHRIVLYDYRKMKKIAQVGIMGFYRREFRYPFDAKIDKNGDIYISEVINTRVQILDKDLRFVNIIGKWGVKSGTFYRPKGIEFYKNYVIVADGYLGVVQFFDKKEKNVKYILAKNDKILKFKSPVRLRIFNNLLGIVDYFTKEVFIFKIED